MPKAKQFSVSHENRPGMLAEIAKALGDQKVNILSCLTTTSGTEGTTHLLVDNGETLREGCVNRLRSRKRKRASVKFDLLREASKRITRCRSSHFALLKQGQRSTCLAYDLALLRTQIPEFKSVTVA